AGANALAVVVGYYLGVVWVRGVGPGAVGGRRRHAGQWNPGHVRSAELASHGNAVAKAVPAVGQSCFPGWATTAQSMPFARPSAHRDAAAAAGLPRAGAPRR